MDDLTAHNMSNVTFLVAKATEECRSGEIDPYQYMDTLRLIQRLVSEGRVEEFMQVNGYPLLDVDGKEVND